MVLHTTVWLRHWATISAHKFIITLLFPFNLHSLKPLLKKNAKVSISSKDNFSLSLASKQDWPILLKFNIFLWIIASVIFRLILLRNWSFFTLMTNRTFLMFSWYMWLWRSNPVFLDDWANGFTCGGRMVSATDFTNKHFKAVHTRL